ncbi:Polyferredoxin TDE2371 [Olavius algarvensis associated proteobacterium Delta 3]|nr:Polyferredoxin TDE2371 [Olavius algarvensis associated proteobacterium Delta 3]
MSLRRWIQILATFLSNGYWQFPATGSIYKGTLKSVCVPGLNCYSCPAATGACPLGAIQTFMATLRPNIEAARFHLGLYVIGFLGVIGSLVGRMPCGWVCPFGFFQELLHKIPSPKFEIPKFLNHFKYVFLVLFVFLLPLLVVDEFGYGMTWFCKHVCPAGTIEAGIPMMILKPELQGLIGLLFYSKLLILVLFLIWMVLSRRPFCRTACPLGAIYSLFNRTNAFRMVHHPDNCTRCQACYSNCPMGVKFFETSNHTNCIRCLKCLQESCKFDAISYEIAGLPTPEPKPNET